MSRSYTSSPPSASMACKGTALLFFVSLVTVFTDNLSILTYLPSVPHVRSCHQYHLLLLAHSNLRVNFMSLYTNHQNALLENQ
jgi:hypothetical protein